MSPPYTPGGARAWTVEVPENGLDPELEFLRREVYRVRVDPPVARITAYERYSARV